MVSCYIACSFCQYDVYYKQCEYIYCEYCGKSYIYCGECDQDKPDENAVFCECFFIDLNENIEEEIVINQIPD